MTDRDETQDFGRLALQAMRERHDAARGPCPTCGGDGSGLTPENDGRGAQCPSCLTWNIDFCPNCGDEFEAPCIRHTNTDHY